MCFLTVYEPIKYQKLSILCELFHDVIIITARAYGLRVAFLQTYKHNYVNNSERFAFLGNKQQCQKNHRDMNLFGT